MVYKLSCSIKSIPDLQKQMLLEFFYIKFTRMKCRNTSNWLSVKLQLFYLIVNHLFSRYTQVIKINELSARKRNHKVMNLVWILFVFQIVGPVHTQWRAVLSSSTPERSSFLCPNTRLVHNQVSGAGPFKFRQYWNYLSKPTKMSKEHSSSMPCLRKSSLKYSGRE